MGPGLLDSARHVSRVANETGRPLAAAATLLRQGPWQRPDFELVFVPEAKDKPYDEPL